MSLLGIASDYINPSTTEASLLEKKKPAPSYNINMEIDTPLEATRDFSSENFQDLNREFSQGWEVGGNPLAYNKNLELYQESWNKNNPNLPQLTVDGRYGSQMDTHFRGLQYPDNELVTDATGTNVPNPISTPVEEPIPEDEEAGTGLLAAAKKPWKFQGWDYKPFKGF